MQKNTNEYYKYIRSHIDIADVCKALDMQLRPMGKDYITQCFLHSDEHPSLRIFTEENRYHCFQCGENGDIFQLVKGKLDCDFTRALSWLEEHFPQVLSEKPDVSSEQVDGGRSRYADGFELAWDCYRKMTEEEEADLRLFAEKRGYAPDFLKESEVVFVSKQKLKNQYGEDERFIEEQNLLQEAGLLQKVSRTENTPGMRIRYEDYFRTDRVIVALRDQKGKLVGFAGRSVSDSDRPKYLFTRNLNKKDWLYGFDAVCGNAHSRNSRKKEEVLYLVEGIFDALRLRSKNISAVAVMGSHLLQGQVKVLADYVSRSRSMVDLRVLMDSDEAGLRGNFQTVKSLWNSEVLRKTPVKVSVLKEGKDPDECLKGKTVSTKHFATYSAIEYVFRYLLYSGGEQPIQGTQLVDLDPEEAYNRGSTDEKLFLLRQMEELMTKNEWQQMLGWQSGLPDIKDARNYSEHFIWNLIRQYLSGSSDGEEYGRTQEKEYLYHMHTALQIARTSHDRESLLLDEDSWDRIAAGADAFFPYFYGLLEEGKSIDTIPMIEIYTPKKKDVQRRKTLYIHEELLLQQYVLNELLSPGIHRMYEELIPAVRFSDGTGSRVTGYGAPGEVVSFAYQIDMAAVNGTKEIRQGMFRPFYDCWKEYIQYVRDGIEKLDGKRVYKVKLDIRGFYDNIPKRALRDALYRPIQQALLKDDKKFRCFRHKDGEADTRAHLLVQWLLNELYKDDCYSAQTGRSYKRESGSSGIPQGPNLSAYAANVLLFDLDRQIYDIVQEENRRCEEGRIAVRYCRYVDDMIIIASDPLVLLRIKDTISGILYDLGLELSNKTDEEESVSKEEAFDWTVSARGGLGVSAGFDMADDSLESVIDDCDGYDVVDRREALKLLSGALQPVLYETAENRSFQETVSEAQLLNIIFQTEEIRINDIIRFSELLICRITESEEDLFGAYRRLWDEGKKSCPQDSVLQTAGIEVYVFLESCIKILMRKKRADRESLYQGWTAAAKKIEETVHPTGELAQRILRSIPEEELLKKNRWILCLKYVEICSLLQMREDTFANTELFENNCYGERWLWTVSGEKIPEISENAGSLQCFQFVLAQYQKADCGECIQEINSQIRNYKGYLKTFWSQQDLLIRCIEIWTNTDSDRTYSDQELRLALCVLLNILPDRQKAETIENIRPLAGYLFPEEEGMQVLPVFPGVDYPGMMAYKKQEAFFTAERYDFQTDDAKTGADSAWEMKETEKVSGKAKHYIRKWPDRGECYVSLEEYFRQDTGRLETEKDIYPVLTVLMSKVLEVYPVVKEEIQRISDAHREEKLLLSKKNVILCKEPEGSTIRSADLGLSYLISSRKTGDAVALEKNGNYVLEKVNESGASFWIAGRLLADAIRLTQIHLQTDDRNSESAKCAAMLRYVFRRLEGHYLHLPTCGKKGPHSWEKTVKRALGHLKSFLDREDHRDVYLENAGEEDNFIAFRLGRDIYDFEDISLEVAIWAKNCLRGHYPELVRLMDELPDFRQEQFALKRRVPKWYCYLADHLYQLASPESSDFPAVRTLSAGFFADGILMNLRMQTLERIQALDQRRRDAFLVRTEIPYAELGLAENSVLLTGEQKDSRWERLWKNLLNRKTDRNIRHLTHLGWIVLLAKLYELDKTTGYIYPENQNLREKAQRCLGKLVEILTDKQMDSDLPFDFPLEFPYEGMESFYALWKPENVLQIIEEMNLLDKVSGIIVEKGRFADYNQKVRKDEVTIWYGNYMFTEPSGFLTYSKLDGRISALEKDAEEKNKTVFTQTRKGETVLGISTIAEPFGRLLQAWEKKAEEQADAALENKADDPGEALQENDRTDEKAGEEERNLREAAKQDGAAVSGSAPGDSSEKVKDTFFGTGFDALRKEQRVLWESRRKELEFSNFDRIALFQFSIDSSYYSPSTEKCRMNLMESRETGSEDKDAGEKSCRDPESFPSCAEYRRREILKPVLETCSIFGVEILLLPEYSIRPETADWIADTIYNRKYKFSVWAGTFRIPANHQFPSGRYWDNEKKLNSKEYRHAAVLPVILNDPKDGDRQVKIVTHRVKKYPSVALHEEINPYPGVGNNNFKPLVKKYYESRYADNHLLGDARDHVTELICAEVFAVCAICNYPSLLKESFAAFQKYAPGKEENAGSNAADTENAAESHSEEKRKIPGRFEEYEQEMLEDIREYGKYTAIYQMQKHFLRTPIVLVPACTTRAADYYVWGQGQYLAAGLKMVLCNSTGLETRGGSCFIGQESWDDRNITYDEMKLCNTIYHGLKPGIFRQSSPDKVRGALGSKEQALLICDVNPNYEKSQPNAESMLDSLSLVAHIPVFEEQIYRDEKCAGCRNHYLCKGNTGENSRKHTEDRLKVLINHVNAEETSLWKNTMDADAKYMVEKNIKTDQTTDDQPVNKSYIADKLRWLGKKYESKWLERRADFYEKYSTIRPQKWPAPTILDWLYIKVDYKKFMDAKHSSEDECAIQMTE